MKTIKAFDEQNLKKVPQINPGDTVRVATKIKEGNKERIQTFEGVVLKVQNGSGIGGSFTVRKISYGIGVERTFMLHSPQLSQIKIVKRAEVRRANIGYLRDLKGKSVKLKEKQFDILAVNVAEEELAPIDKEEKEDRQLTEINEDALAEADVESMKEEEKKENKKAENEEKEKPEEDEEQLPAKEVVEGLEKAEEDIEKGKTQEGSRQEKKPEDIQDEK